MKLGLILSNDWELFGDGSGDYFELQHRPLKNLLNAAEDYGAKITVMADVAQQWAHQKMAGREKWAREICEAWEGLLKETIQRKHDVQLHIHPQWCDAQYDGQKWIVNLANWTLASLQDEILGKILKQGKQYLKEILKPVDNIYECLAFRAGAYCIEPSRCVIPHLLNAGLICDSSVIKGMHNEDFFDYRDAYSTFIPWFVKQDNIKYRSEQEVGLLEFPICSYKNFESAFIRRLVPAWLYFGMFYRVGVSKDEEEWAKERHEFERKKYPKDRRPYVANFAQMSFKSWLGKLFSRNVQKLDYDRLLPSVFVKILKGVLHDGSLRQYQGIKSVISVMAIGHVKNIHNCENLKRILDEIDRSIVRDVVYMTLSEAIKHWLGDKKMATRD
jgi:hypothetical protein